MDLLKNVFDSRYRFSFMSGFCACCSSLFGKLAGKISNEFLLYEVVFKGVLILLMFLSGAAVWTFFVKALQRSPTTIVPTLISSATNYTLSAIFGFLLFDEPITMLWLCGMILVTSGLMMITKSSNPSSGQLHESPADKVSTEMKKSC